MKKLLKYLYEKLNFNPHNIMINFNLSQINGLKNIFCNNISIHVCFLNYSQNQYELISVNLDYAIKIVTIQMQNYNLIYNY